jgi:succinoglycan biosynthesis protein ExoM
MSPEIVRVDICVATFKRPQSLARLLDSLDALRIPARIEVRVIITDNDLEESARKTVADFAQRVKYPVTYVVEPEKNISIARNRCVILASGEYIAFVDDDEEVSSGWLAYLIASSLDFCASAVFGPVIYRLPPNAPEWIREGSFYRSRRYPTGTPVPAGGTGNVLLRSSILKGQPEPFSSQFGLTGGEDTDLFTRLNEKGASFIWCDEAEVFEHVGNERLTIRYLLGRALRGGQQFAVIKFARSSFFMRCAWFGYRLLLAGIALTGALCSFPLGRRRWVWCMQKFCSNVGQLLVVTRYRYEQYR